MHSSSLRLPHLQNRIRSIIGLQPQCSHASRYSKRSRHSQASEGKFGTTPWPSIDLNAERAQHRVPPPSYSSMELLSSPGSQAASPTPNRWNACSHPRRLRSMVANLCGEASLSSFHASVHPHTPTMRSSHSMALRGTMSGLTMPRSWTPMPEFP